MARFVQDRTAPKAAIGLYMPMTLECVVAYLGIVRAGRRVVSIADSFSPEELRKRMEIAEASLVVTSSGYQWSGKVIRPYDKVRKAEIPRAVVITGVAKSTSLRDQDIPWEAVLATTNEFTSSPADPYDVINVLFSSGTTGVPKAIPWTHLTPIKMRDGRSLSSRHRFGRHRGLADEYWLDDGPMVDLRNPHEQGNHGPLRGRPHGKRLRPLHRRS